MNDEIEEYTKEKIFQERKYENINNKYSDLVKKLESIQN